MTQKFKQVACAAVVGVLAAAAPASAATTTIAQFVQATPSTRIFTYTNANSGGSVARLGTVSGSNTVLISNLGMLQSPTTARVNLTAFAIALPTITSTQISQLFTGSLTFTLLAPQVGNSGPSTNALRVDFTNASLLASPGGTALTFQANSEAGSNIVFSSDFLDLSGTTSQDFSLSFSGSTLPLTALNGRLPNFRISDRARLRPKCRTPCRSQQAGR